MIVRIVFLLLLSVAMVVAGGVANIGPIDAEAQLFELEAEDEIIAERIVIDVQVVSIASPLVQGTEADHPSPELGRVFRPPRAALVRIS